MAKTVSEMWQIYCDRLAEARKSEAETFTAVNQSFKGSAPGPTVDEYWALARARNKTHRVKEQLMAFAHGKVRLK